MNPTAAKVSKKIVAWFILMDIKYPTMAPTITVSATRKSYKSNIFPTPPFLVLSGNVS